MEGSSLRSRDKRLSLNLVSTLHKFKTLAHKLQSGSFHILVFNHSLPLFSRRILKIEKVPGFGQFLCWLLCGLRQPLREEGG